MKLTHGDLLDPFVRALLFLLDDVSGDGVAAVVSGWIPRQRDGVLRRTFALGWRAFARSVVGRFRHDRLVRLQRIRQAVSVLGEEYG